MTDNFLIQKIIEQLTDVLGSVKNAQLWLETPALALDSAKPIDLLETQQGLENVQNLIIRMDYGVYT